MMVLITGAVGGLGRAMSVECARRGYDLFLTDLCEAELERLRNGIQRQYDVTVVTKTCDLTDEADVSELFSYVDEQQIGFDMLLNIAGIDFEGEFMERECKNIIDIVQLNVEATLRITYEALARRIPDNKFSIVFVSSLASLYPMPLKATYAASKRFLLDFSIALNEELKDKNATVLSLCPGGLPTTQEAMMGIAAQGFWGNVTTNKLEEVARKTISKALAGRSVFIPGRLNSTLSILGKFIPRALVVKLLYHRWHGAQSKWLKVD